MTVYIIIGNSFGGIYNKCTHSLTAIYEGAIEALGPKN